MVRLQILCYSSIYLPLEVSSTSGKPTGRAGGAATAAAAGGAAGGTGAAPSMITFGDFRDGGRAAGPALAVFNTVLPGAVGSAAVAALAFAFGAVLADLIAYAFFFGAAGGGAGGSSAGGRPTAAGWSPLRRADLLVAMAKLETHCSPSLILISKNLLSGNKAIAKWHQESLGCCPGIVLCCKKQSIVTSSIGSDISRIGHGEGNMDSLSLTYQLPVLSPP